MSFFLCRDRAWLANPPKIKGGPCSLGHLTVLAPSVSMAYILTRTKRSVHQFEKDCNEKITYWKRTTEIILSSLLLWVAAAKALKQLDGIGC